MSERLKGGGSSDDDIWSILKEHGGGFGRPISPDQMSGPYRPVSDLEAVLNDHGVGVVGVPADPMEKMGTRDEDLLNIVNKLRHASWSENVQEDINALPPKSIGELVGWRYKQSANALDDRYSDKKALGENLKFDLSIIAAAIDSGKEIPDVETAQYVGESDMRGLSGVLDAYADKIRESGREIYLYDARAEAQGEPQEPLYALDVIDKMKKIIEGPSGEENT